MPKNDDVKPPWWYTSANPQTVNLKAEQIYDNSFIDAAQ